MDEEIILGEKKYISSRRAGEIFGYASDYVTQLCRGGKIDARRIGQTWFIAEESLKDHAQTKIPRRPRSGSLSAPRISALSPFNLSAPSASASVDSWESSLLKETKDIEEQGGEPENFIPIKHFLSEYKPKNTYAIERIFEPPPRHDGGLVSKAPIHRRSSAIALFLWGVVSIFLFFFVFFLTTKEGVIVYDMAQNAISLDGTAQHATVIDTQ